MSLAKALPLISIIDFFEIGSKSKCIAWVIASRDTWYSCFTMGFAYCSWWLPPPRWLGAAEEDWHELVIIRGHLWWLRGFVPSPAERWKVTLVDCSCHWVTSLVGRFLRRHLLARCVIPISRQTTKWLSTQRGLACWQAREPREKILVSLVWLEFSQWLDWLHIDWFIPRHGGIITLLTPLHFLQTSCQAL